VRLHLQREDLGLLAWARNQGRFMDIAGALGVRPRIIDFPRLRTRWSAPLRYPTALALTGAWLVRRRPRVVIVCCPPPFAAALVALYARLFGAGYILDAHPGAFGHRDRLWRLFVPVQRRLVRGARATLVTEPQLGETVRSWGGAPLVFHEAPPPIAVPTAARAPGSRPKVLFATVFDPDEPLEAITQAACVLEECDVLITGAHSRLAREFRECLSRMSHVCLTGWLEQEDYLSLAARADVVVALTNDPHSVMRSAFEAIYLGRPSVLSDTQALRECFSPSVFVTHSGEALAGGVRAALRDHSYWLSQADPRRDALLRRWVEQRAALELVIAQAARPAPAGVGGGAPGLQ
jgi:glycosyltransferase involved in cell wall biosynthesis